MTLMTFPADVYAMDIDQLAYHVAARLKQLAPNQPTEVAGIIEDELIPALNAVECWEPSDEDMMSSFGTKWHDGL